jgi:hypothetical protein
MPRGAADTTNPAIALAKVNPVMALAVSCALVLVWCALAVRWSHLPKSLCKLSSSRVLRKLGSSLRALDTTLEQTPAAVRPILQELMQTERAYLCDLRRLCACHEAFPELSLGHAAALQILHVELASSMGAPDDDSAPWETPSLSQVACAFTRLAPFLRTYSEFVLGQYDRIKAVDALRSRSHGAQRLAQWSEREGHPVGSLLIKPVQVSSTGYPCNRAPCSQSLRSLPLPNQIADPSATCC